MGWVGLLDRLFSAASGWGRRGAASAWAARERTAYLGMVDRHGGYQFASYGLGVLLVDELGEDAFEVG